MVARVFWVSSYLRISHPEKLEAYAALALPAIKAEGGRILARVLPLHTYEQEQSERVVSLNLTASKLRAACMTEQTIKTHWQRWPMVRNAISGSLKLSDGMNAILSVQFTLPE